MFNNVISRNYIVELEAGNSGGGFDSSSFNSLFIISISLTDKGMENITYVIIVTHDSIGLS